MGSSQRNHVSFEAKHDFLFAGYLGLAISILQVGLVHLQLGPSCQQSAAPPGRPN